MRRGLLVGAALVCACGRRPPKVDPPDVGAPPPPPLESAPPAQVAIDMLAPSPRCRVEHRGTLIDLGSSEAAWSTPGRPDAASDVPGFERDGATWGRVLDRGQTFTVAIDSSGTALVSIRGRARGAKKAVASIDGKAVGALTLSPDEDKVVTVTNPQVSLSPGLHVVSLRWAGPVKKDEPLAELDWIRVGTVDGDAATFAAPSRNDAVAQIAIGGAPRKAFVLMAPAVVRCVGWIPPGATLAADVGAIGEGSDGEVELRERETGSDPSRMIARATASPKSWSGLSAPLTIGGATGAMGVVEIAVTRAPKQGRVAIAEPRVLRASAKVEAVPAGASATQVIVVVLAGLGGGEPALPSLRKLAQEGVVFSAHRAPSALAPASVASLVTGLPVPVHALEDAAARLSPRTPLVGKLLAPFGVESAMLTEVPTTGPAFGFAHDFGYFAARTPLDGPSTAFDDLSKFLSSKTGRKLVVITHARGAHPPWDVTAEALKTLPPEGYTGPIDPKHVVNVLYKARRGLLKLTDADRTRLRALSDVALAEQDRKLAALVEELRANGTLDKTLLVVTSDAPYLIPAAAPDPKAAAPSPSSSGVPPTVPREVVDPIEEPLVIPLVVRFPGAAYAGRVVTTVTDPTDVAATIVTTFGGVTVDLSGRDLARLTREEETMRDVPHLADDGRGYVLSWGTLRLSGTWGKTPALRVRLKGEEVRSKRPFEYLAAWGLAAAARDRWLQARAKGPGREPATIDPMTHAAMEAWERERRK